MEKNETRIMPADCNAVKVIEFIEATPKQGRKVEAIQHIYRNEANKEYQIGYRIALSDNEGAAGYFVNAADFTDICEKYHIKAQVQEFSR